MIFGLHDPRYPQSCEDCRSGRIRGWDPDRRCRPRCFFEGLEPFAVRMWRLWQLIGLGEALGEGTVQWNIDWGAFEAARNCRHPLFSVDDPAEVYEAMLLVRREMNRSPANQLWDMQREAADADE